jgi:hypothetical protein
MRRPLRSPIGGNLLDEPAGNVYVGNGRGETASHQRAGKNHDARVDGDINWVGVAPAQLIRYGIADLSEQKVGGLLPARQRAERGGGADPPRRHPGKHRIRSAAPGFFNHRADGQVAGAPAQSGFVTVDEQELPNPISGGGEQVAAKSEQVAVPGVEARDAVPAHSLHLVRDRDAGNGRAANVVVRDEECVGDRT